MIDNFGHEIPDDKIIGVEEWKGAPGLDGSVHPWYYVVYDDAKSAAGFQRVRSPISEETFKEYELRNPLVNEDAK